MKRLPLATIIVAATFLIALLDFSTSARLVGSILFTLPLALCALQRSKSLLWSTAAVTVIVTIAAGFWGFNRVNLPHPSVLSLNRDTLGFLVASLFAVATLVHFWIEKSQRADLIASEIQGQGSGLAAQNEQLEIQGSGWTRETEVREEAGRHPAQIECDRGVVEEELRESEERCRLILEGIQDYAIFMMDLRGHVVSWNAGAERIKGYRADQIIGQNFSCFFPPEEVERGRPAEVLRMTAASGRHEEQGMRVRKDGSRFLASVTFTALRDVAGNLRGFSEFSHDLSESKESEAKYRGLLEAAPDAMVVVNADGEIVLLNVQAEKEFGYRRDELVGQRVKNIIPEGFAERLIADGTRTAADALAQQIGMGIELIGRRKDGTEFPIELMLSPLASAEGILVTAAIRNITERKKAEDHLVKTVGELKRSNEELQQFAYVASHDLQEPLRMVASFTQLLAKRYKGRLDSDADEFIAYAVEGSFRMQGLIEDLLAYSRAGISEKALQQISSEKALNEALANLRATIQESGAVVTRDPLPAIITDETQLVQVFQNLVGNAVKYHGSKAPLIHVSATKNGREEWIFSVRDNGLGIDPQYFQRIFVLFQRLHGREQFKGTGIGLAICKKILERLGGRIWVESQPEMGSTFYFTLPERDGK
jgi:PAS domain S-box-containing protein